MTGGAVEAVDDNLVNRASLGVEQDAAPAKAVAVVILVHDCQSVEDAAGVDGQESVKSAAGGGECRTLPSSSVTAMSSSSCL